ncbi:MAG TPA: hypothetical protein VJ863_10065 [Sphaerochaeta sp.]|nr:hypothetical protein [Sphaerochaeta sp.]
MVTYLIILFVVVAILFGSTAAGFLALRVVIWIVVILVVLSFFGIGFFYIRTPSGIASLPTVMTYFLG